MTAGEALSKGDLWEEYSTNLHAAYNAVRRAFKRSGLSQDQLAKRLGVDKALISKRLNGTENLTFKTLSFMASAMGCRLAIDCIPYESVATTSDAGRPRVQIASGQGTLSTYLPSTATKPAPEASMKISASPTVQVSSANLRFSEAA